MDGMIGMRSTEEFLESNFFFGENFKMSELESREHSTLTDDDLTELNRSRELKEFYSFYIYYFTDVKKFAKHIKKHSFNGCSKLREIYSYNL